MTTTKKKRGAVLPEAGDRPKEDRKISGTDIHMEAYTESHPLAPQRGPYRFDAGLVNDVRIGLSLGTNMMFTGPTGCGKTSLIKELAAELGRPFVRFNCNGETRVANIVGQQRPAAVDGVLTLQFNLGDMAIALKEGYWVLCDEFDAAMASVLMVLHPILEEGNRKLHIPETGETVEAHSDFAFFATGNTIGYRAPMRSRHAGTQRMNVATLDRFGMIIECGYPERKEEIQRVACHVPKLYETRPDLLDTACRVAACLRDGVYPGSEAKTADYQSDFSTRQLIQWCKLIEVYGDQTMRAAELAFLRKLESAADAEVAREIINRLFGYEK